MGETAHVQTTTTRLLSMTCLVLPTLYDSPSHPPSFSSGRGICCLLSAVCFNGVGGYERNSARMGRALRASAYELLPRTQLISSDSDDSTMDDTVDLPPFAFRFPITRGARKCSFLFLFLARSASLFDDYLGFHSDHSYHPPYMAFSPVHTCLYFISPFPQSHRHRSI